MQDTNKNSYFLQDSPPNSRLKSRGCGGKFVKCTDKGYEYDDWTPLEEHLENDAVPQVHISLDAAKGSVADALRELADYIEECDSDKSTEYPTQYESDICVAEFKED